MSTPNDAAANNPANELHTRALDDLASVALGEQAEPELAAHIADCPICRVELSAFERVATLGRIGERSSAGHDEVPPPTVWRRIEAATSTTPAPVETIDRPAYEPTHRASDPQSPAPAAPVRRSSARWRRPLLAAAAVVLIAGAAVGGWAVGHTSSSSAPEQAAPVALAAQPGTAANVHGTATMHTTDAGLTMEIRTDGLPAPEGYYEVWLFDPSANKMVAVGTLGTGGRGLFTMPSGIDLAAYHVVDVSAQKYNGNPAHQQSVLRGQLPS